MIDPVNPSAPISAWRVFRERVDSTSLEAKRLYNGAPLRVVAAEQTAGMGRLGRTWQSPRGGLWMSLATPLRAPVDRYAAAPLAAGLAVVEAVEAVCGLSATIKWPNDVCVGDRKLAGILCQCEPGRDMLVVGIGINANFPATALPEGLRRPPTSLLDERGAPVDLEALEAMLVSRLDELLAACEQGFFAERVLPGVQARLCWMGARVRSTDGAGTVFGEGVITGIDENGALLLATDEGTHALAVGEITRT